MQGLLFVLWPASLNPGMSPATSMFHRPVPESLLASELASSSERQRHPAVMHDPTSLCCLWHSVTHTCQDTVHVSVRDDMHGSQIAADMTRMRHDPQEACQQAAHPGWP